MQAAIEATNAVIILKEAHNPVNCAIHQAPYAQHLDQAAQH